jgi:hypothetical protein
MEASLRLSRQPSGSHSTLPEGNDDENREVSQKLSLFSKDKATNESSSSFPECNEKKPIFYNFLGLQENDDQADQVGEADEGLGQITKSQHGSEEISLELNVGCASYTTKKRKANENLLACSAKRTKLSCRKVRREEMLSGVSLGVDLWAIKKMITTSDIGDSSRLLLATDGVERHILPLWDANRKESLHEGVQVCVWDCDTKSEHQLVFKRWASNGSYVLIGKWIKEFVKRRVLNKGDEIGLYWDETNSRFNFRILNRA